MNVKSQDPTDVVIALIDRSICAVQVAALCVDNMGIFAWAWNHMGFTGLGQHAEAHCIIRANRKRLVGATMYVAAKRARNNKIVTARPCASCEPIVRVCRNVIYRNAEGDWVEL